MDGGGDASQPVNREPGSLCSSTLISPHLTRALDYGAGDSTRAVRSPQDRPAFLQSRYEDDPINALPGPNPEIVWPALYREWLSLRLVLDGDRAFDHMLQRCVLSRERHAKLERATLNLALANDTLDFPLRGDAHLFEELANVDVEAVLIHRGLLRAT